MMILTKLCLLLFLLGRSVGALRLVPLMGDGSGLLIATVNGTEGGVCPDEFTLREASVVCRQLGLGWGRFLRPMQFDPELIASQKHVVKISHCFGSEAQMRNCRMEANPNGVPCRSAQTMGVRCTQSLPDLEPDVEMVQRTSYVMQVPLYTIECALEENCLAPSAATAFLNANRAGRVSQHRLLLRFSSIVKNVGTAPFLPLLEKEEWKFHPCHRHYHSMANFAKYAVYNYNASKVAVGHKASFCLEDSECPGGVQKHFRCSREPNNYGTQGISPGCQDTYFHDYDCQWVDITGLKPGRYMFQMAINPNYAVAESSYSNNGIECAFFHHPPESGLHGCRVMHPLNLRL